MNATEMRKRAVCDQLATAFREILAEHGYELVELDDKNVDQVTMSITPPAGEEKMRQFVEMATERVGVDLTPNVIKIEDDD